MKCWWMTMPLTEQDQVLFFWFKFEEKTVLKKNKQNKVTSKWLSLLYTSVQSWQHPQHKSYSHKWCILGWSTAYALKVHALDGQSQFSHLSDPLPFAPLSLLTQSNYFFPSITALIRKRERESTPEWNDGCLILLQYLLQNPEWTM